MKKGIKIGLIITIVIVLLVVIMAVFSNSGGNSNATVSAQMMNRQSEPLQTRHATNISRDLDWRFTRLIDMEVGGSSGAILTILQDDNFAYIGGEGGFFAILDKSTFEVTQIEIPGTSWDLTRIEHMVQDDYYIYIGCWLGRFRRFCKTTWTFTESRNTPAWPWGFSSITSDENYVYLGTTEGWLIRYNKVTSSFSQRIEVTEERIRSITLDDDRAFIGSGRNRLIAFDRITDTITTEHELPEWLSFAEIITFDEHFVYIVDMGRLMRFNKLTESFEETIWLGRAINDAAIHGDYLYLAGHQGLVTRFCRITQTVVENLQTFAHDTGNSVASAILAASIGEDFIFVGGLWGQFGIFDKTGQFTQSLEIVMDVDHRLVAEFAIPQNVTWNIEFKHDLMGYLTEHYGLSPVLSFYYISENEHKIQDGTVFTGSSRVLVIDHSNEYPENCDELECSCIEDNTCDLPDCDCLKDDDCEQDCENETEPDDTETDEGGDETEENPGNGNDNNGSDDTGTGPSDTNNPDINNPTNNLAWIGFVMLPLFILGIGYCVYVAISKRKQDEGEIDAKPKTNRKSKT